jgi:hypothetical protein
MRPTARLLLVLMLCLAPCLTGCAKLGAAWRGLTQPVTRTTDKERVSDYEGNYNLVMEVLTFAGLHGWIPPAQQDEIEPFRVTANDAIDKMKADVNAGVPLDASLERVLIDALAKLSTYKAQYEPRVKAARAGKVPAGAKPAVSGGKQPLKTPSTRPVTGPAGPQPTEGSSDDARSLDIGSRGPAMGPEYLGRAGTPWRSANRCADRYARAASGRAESNLVCYSSQQARTAAGRTGRDRGHWRA